VCQKQSLTRAKSATRKWQSVEGTPFENLIVDFTEMPWARECKYLLVFVYTFSGWVEAFPT
jgi:hypothetical protein